MKLYKLLCEYCGKLFSVNQYRLYRAQFCSNDCRNKAHSIKVKGRPSHRKGKHLTEEHKKRISDGNKGIPRPVAVKASAEFRRGKPLSEEHRKKISESHKGEKNHFYGKHHTEETKKTISEVQKGKKRGPMCEEAKDKLRKYCGEKSSNWQGGISYGKYCPKFNNKKKEEIRDLYDRKCFVCNLDEKDNIFTTGRHRKLPVHHIDGDKEQGCNGKKWYLVPLCSKCHGKVGVRKNGRHYIQYIRELLKFHAIKDFWTWMI